MKDLYLLAVGLLVVVAGAPVGAEPTGPAFPGNEAVRLVNGKKSVELPPLTAIAQRSVQGGAKMPPPSPSGEVFMIETSHGLVECRGPFVSDTGCVPSSLGVTKRPRLWTVKLAGVWAHCSSRTTTRKCEPAAAGSPGAMGTVE